MSENEACEKHAVLGELSSEDSLDDDASHVINALAIKGLSGQTIPLEGQGPTIRCEPHPYGQARQTHTLMLESRVKQTLTVREMLSQLGLAEQHVPTQLAIIFAHFQLGCRVLRVSTAHVKRAAALSAEQFNIQRCFLLRSHSVKSHTTICLSLKASKPNVNALIRLVTNHSATHQQTELCGGKAFGSHSAGRK